MGKKDYKHLFLQGFAKTQGFTSDKLASGYLDDNKRLVILSSGNLGESFYWRSYPEANLVNEVQDPAQAWNAISVGAFSEKTRIIDPSLTNWKAIAPPGGLSPFSTTSITWPEKTWPLKPEVVFEGGNVARGLNNSTLDCDDLQLLSLHPDPQTAQFAPFNATSAAAAQAALLAAKIQARYPEAWPETIRALISNSPFQDWYGLRPDYYPHPEYSEISEDNKKFSKICGMPGS